MAFDPTKPVQTRDGRKARIICTDRKWTDNIFCIIALVADTDGDECLEIYTKDGYFYSNDEVNGSDLINIPERHKHADLIIAWANGAEIQFFSNLTDIWSDTKLPTWDIHTLYRIKPE